MTDHLNPSSGIGSNHYVKVTEEGETTEVPMELKVKGSYKFWFWLFVNITGFHVGYTMAYTN
jgi:hypothetical protein